MSEALEQAYASNVGTPLNTIEFIHSGITGGALRLVQAYTDIVATLEDSSVVTFSKSGMGISLPERSVDGRHDLLIQIDNVSLVAYQEISAAKEATRITQEKIICKYRPFLESDLSAPAGSTIILTVNQTTVTRNSVSINATYTPIPEMIWPINRYTTDKYPGVMYL